MAKRSFWTQQQLQKLKQRYPDTLTADLVALLGHPLPSIYGKAAELGLKKSAAFHASSQSGRMQAGDNRGQSRRFQQGHQPFNKGVKGWQAGGNSQKTQFKKGHRGGEAEKKYQPIGTERLSKEGYLQRKTNDDMPLQGRWKAVHHLLWIEHNGPIPSGHALIFKNGNKQDIRLDNLELISRGELMQRNSIHRYPDQLKTTIRLIKKLERKINEQEHTRP